MLEHVPCARYKLQEAGYLNYLDVIKKHLADVIPQVNEQTVDAIHTRGVCLYYQGNMKQSSNHFRYASWPAQNHGQSQLQMNNYERTKDFKK
jgi:hypothetical protein